MSSARPATELVIDRIPDGWTRAKPPGHFSADGLLTKRPVVAAIRVFRPLDENPDYLLHRVGAHRVGPMGRPRVQSLPDALSDGVSVVSFEEAIDQSFVARIDLVRRAYGVDIVVTARTVELEIVEVLFSEMLELLAAVGTPV